jgi:hypothetical protein
MFSGSDPVNPNGTQTIDGSFYQTLQTQIATNSANIGGNARIITYAEALSPVAF